MKGFLESQNSKVVGLWRRDATKAQASASQFSIPLIFDTPEALCASPEIDAVFIVSPDALHLPHVLLAAKHGKAILCEKPLALNAGEVEQMLAAANTASVPFGVAQNMRYNRSLDVMRRWIAEGRIGQAAARTFPVFLFGRRQPAHLDLRSHARDRRTHRRRRHPLHRRPALCPRNRRDRREHARAPRLRFGRRGIACRHRSRSRLRRHGWR